MTIFKQFTFDSAHFLPNVPDGHKCKGIHGHTYKLTLFLDGPLEANLGWVADFGEVKAAANTVIALIDHKLLNEIKGLENPTCELLAIWLWRQMKPAIPMLKLIELYETPTSGTIYEGG
jgi:6-pyruvoyltetrahydropterin/6-carboxytetrahydropterin synthase